MVLGGGGKAAVTPCRASFSLGLPITLTRMLMCTSTLSSALARVGGQSGPFLVVPKPLPWLEAGPVSFLCSPFAFGVFPAPCSSPEYTPSLASPGPCPSRPVSNPRAWPGKTVYLVLSSLVPPWGTSGMQAPLSWSHLAYFFICSFTYSD
jgi:hypothetical protein